MYAKLHFNVTNVTSIFDIVVSLLTGTTDKYQLTGTGLDHTKSYILTTKNPAGWRLDYRSEDNFTAILSSPCENSSKRKFIKLVQSGLQIECYCGYDFTGSDILTISNTTRLVYQDAGLHPLTIRDFEVRVSASARHFLFTAGRQGYATGYGNNTQGSTGAVTAVFEHTCADSYFTEDTDYVPVVVHSGGSHNSNSSASYSANCWYSPRYRNLKSNSIVDVTGSTAVASWFTRFAATANLLDATMNGTGRVQTSESTSTKALIPFGICNNSHYFRGGSVTDLCDVYLGAPGTFRDFVDIKAGSSDSVYSMWNIGYGGYFFAVPKG